MTHYCLLIFVLFLPFVHMAKYCNESSIIDPIILNYNISGGLIYKNITENIVNYTCYYQFKYDKQPPDIDRQWIYFTTAIDLKDTAGYYRTSFIARCNDGKQIFQYTNQNHALTKNILKCVVFDVIILTNQEVMSDVTVLFKIEMLDICVCNSSGAMQFHLPAQSTYNLNTPGFHYTLCPDDMFCTYEITTDENYFVNYGTILDLVRSMTGQSSNMSVQLLDSNGAVLVNCSNVSTNEQTATCIYRSVNNNTLTVSYFFPGTGSWYGAMEASELLTNAVLKLTSSDKRPSGTYDCECSDKPISLPSNGSVTLTANNQNLCYSIDCITTINTVPGNIISYQWNGYSTAQLIDINNIVEVDIDSVDEYGGWQADIRCSNKHKVDQCYPSTGRFGYKNTRTNNTSWTSTIRYRWTTSDYQNNTNFFANWSITLTSVPTPSNCFVSVMPRFYEYLDLDNFLYENATCMYNILTSEYSSDYYHPVIQLADTYNMTSKDSIGPCFTNYGISVSVFDGTKSNSHPLNSYTTCTTDSIVGPGQDMMLVIRRLKSHVDITPRFYASYTYIYKEDYWIYWATPLIMGLVVLVGLMIYTIYIRKRRL